jgi:hypothetical protein
MINRCDVETRALLHIVTLLFAFYHRFSLEVFLQFPPATLQIGKEKTVCAFHGDVQ